MEKLFIFFIVVFFSVSFLYVACSNDDDDDNDEKKSEAEKFCEKNYSDKPDCEICYTYAFQANACMLAPSWDTDSPYIR